MRYPLLRYGHVAENYESKKERCNDMQTNEVKLERIHVLAEVLLSLLVGNPEAQVLTEIILETSTMPEA